MEQKTCNLTESAFANETNVQICRIGHNNSNTTCIKTHGITNDVSIPNKALIDKYKEYKFKENVKIDKRLRQLVVYKCVDCAFSSLKVIV